MPIVLRRSALLIAVLLSISGTAGGPGATQQEDAAQRPTLAAGQTVTRLPDGRWLIVGGDTRPETAAIWDPQTRTTHPIGGPLAPRTWHTATLLPDGTVVLAGGVDAAGRILSAPERFDPATGTFASIADLDLTARARHTATVLPDGRVLFAGGDTVPGAVTAEVWEPGAPMADPVPNSDRLTRRGHSARLRPDGRVAITGGQDGAGRVVSTEEIFDPSVGLFQSVAGDSADVPAPAALVGSRPESHATDVPLDARIALRFSAALDVASVGAGTIALEGPEGPVAARIVSSEEGLLVFVTPARQLAPGATYTLRLAGVRGSTGRRAVSAVVRFTTRAEQREAPVEPIDPEVWSPGATDSAWRESPWLKLPPLDARAGTTALAGQVLLLDGRPLADVTLAIGKTETRSDRTGRFLLKLEGLTGGWHEMLIDGRTATRGGRRYGVFEFGLSLVAGRTNVLPFTIWMPVIDTRNAVRIDSPTRRETVVATPRMPGLELHLPPGTVITDDDGKPVRELSITPIPVDRPPFLLPVGVKVPLYFTIQPGGAYIHVYGSGAAKGAWLVYPNAERQPIGERLPLWTYEPEEKGWHVYGFGTVTPDGTQVTPEPGAVLYELSGAMLAMSNTDDPEPAPPQPRRDGADPVNLATGLFIMAKTDLVLPDVLPLALTRTYRTSDNGVRPFGIGTTHPYNLWFANQQGSPLHVDLILPDGGQIRYEQVTGGWLHTATPTAFYGSTIIEPGANSYADLRLKDGTVYEFPMSGPLQAIRDRFGNRIVLTRAGGQNGNLTKITAPNGRFIELTYDTSNRITQATDNLGRTVGYEYDAAGRLWKVTDAKGGVTEYTYDAAHRMLTIKDPRNIVYLTNEYETSGRVYRQTQADTGVYQFAYTVNGSGQITQTDVTNPRGYVERVVFNSAGHPTAVTRAVGQPEEQVTTYTRLSGSHLVETMTDELGRVTRYQYDSKGNVTSLTRLDGTADAKTTTFTYEPTYGLLASVTDPLNHTTSYAYDQLGRLTSVTDALGHQTTFTTNGGGQVLTVTNALSQTTSFAYELGDLVQVTTPLGHNQTRWVDVAGRVRRVTDAKGATTTFEYDNLNQVTKVTDPLTGETTFTYDGNGNLLTLTDARGKATTWTYNNMDQVQTRTDPLTRQESFAYDLMGNLTSWTDRKNQITTYTYDALDRQTFAGFGTTGTPPSYQSTISYTYDGGDRLTQVVDSGAGTITRGYDLLNRLTSETTPEGSISYTYDAANRRATMTVAGQSAVSYTFDNADRLTGVTQGSANVAIAYDNADRRTSLTLPNGVVMEYGYDTDSQLTGITYKLGAQTLGTLTYDYDANGQRTAVGGTWARTNLPAVLTSATYDNANQIATFSGATFIHDANGNLTSDGVRSYTWNARNQLASLTGPVNGSFAYDGLARRRSKTIAGATTQFLHDGLNLVQELSGESPTANLLTGLGIDQFFTRTDATGARHYSPDALGSTVALSDGSGTTLTEYTYEPFGAFTTSGASTGNSFAFTGREADGTGLLFYRARYYHPAIQRFVSEDPLGFVDGPNSHLLAGNNPTNYVDPLGLQTFIMGGGISAAAPVGPGFDISGGIAINPGFGRCGGAGVFGSAGPAAGLNVGADIFVGYVHGGFSNVRGSTGNVNFTFGPVSITVLVNPRTGRVIGGTAGYGPSLLRRMQASGTQSETGLWGWERCFDEDPFDPYLPDPPPPDDVDDDGGGPVSTDRPRPRSRNPMPGRAK